MAAEQGASMDVARIGHGWQLAPPEKERPRLTSNPVWRPMYTPVELGERHDVSPWLATARKRRNLSQRGLAHLVGVAPRTISYWEAGQHRVHEEVLPRLIEALAA